MRLSRKAGLLVCGVLWIKYECTHTTTQDGYAAGYTAWVVDETGSGLENYIQGYSSYKTVWDGTQYVFEPAGVQDDASADNPGTVYNPAGTTLYRYTVWADGTYRYDHCELLTVPNTIDHYSVGDKICSVRAAKDEYPDAKKGYAYVTTKDEYIIMRYSGMYYAYALADTAGGEANTPVATLSDGILVVSGDGSTSIVDNVLTVSGNGSASNENNILYVRSV